MTPSRLQPNSNPTPAQLRAEFKLNSSRIQAESKPTSSQLQTDSCLPHVLLGLVPCSAMNSPRVCLGLALDSPCVRLELTMSYHVRNGRFFCRMRAECAILSSNAPQMQGECTPTASRFLGVL